MKTRYVAIVPLLSSVLAIIFAGSDANLLAAGDEQPEWKIGLAGAIVAADEPVRMASYGGQERNQL